MADCAPEFALVAACCRWPDSEARRAAIRAAARPIEDWDRVMVVAQRHRVALLLRHGLGTAGIALPPPHDRWLAARAARLTQRNLLHFAQSLRLTDMLGAAQIDHLFVKGESLALLAYGDLTLKSATDIDLLIGPRDIARAGGLLQRSGFRRLLPAPGFPEHELPLYHAMRKDSLWVHDASGVRLELHHRLFNNRHFLPAIDLAAPRQPVSRDGQGSLPTLATPALFAYLCGHGAIQGWQRLKWVADVAALLAGRTEREIAALHDHVQRLGAGRCAGQALLLCRDLLGTQLPPALEKALRRDRRTAALVAAARTTLTGGRGAAEPTGRRMALRNLRCAMLIDRRPPFQLELLRARWVSLADREMLALPRAARFLYPLLRLPLMLARAARPVRSGPSAARQPAQ